MHTRSAGGNRRNQHLHIRTACGRQISVGLLALGDVEHPAERISLDIGPAPGTHDGIWASLTAREARVLAGALIAQSTAAGCAGGKNRHALLADPRP